MPDEQHVLYTSDKEQVKETLKKAEETKLTVFFTLCNHEKTMYRDKPVPKRFLYGGPPTREILYKDIRKWYNWRSEE